MIALERTGRQQRAVLQGQHLRLLADQGDQHRIEFDGDGTGSGGGRHVGRIMPVLARACAVYSPS